MNIGVEFRNYRRDLWERKNKCDKRIILKDESFFFFGGER
jgi:hypothetical protein